MRIRAFWVPFTAAMVLSACDAPIIPLEPGPYNFRLSLPVGSVREDLTFHWDLGETVGVFIPPGAEAFMGRPSLRAALARAADTWGSAAVFSEVRLQETSNIAQARVILRWTDSDGVLGLPAGCSGPVTGATATQLCITEDLVRLQTWPRLDGGDSRALMRVLLNNQAVLDQETVDRLVAHEMGHALGILRHSGNAGDLMWGGLLSSAEVSQRDQVTLRALYQTPVDFEFD